MDPTGAGYTLHQLRHSRLTHLGEDGWSSSMLMALSGHRNLRSLCSPAGGRRTLRPTLSACLRT
ncbi:hypothetical protein [Streptosporangium sp. NPDC087985]|uniref:hypothetical protein n=1 Tax=Streptosporangium sp. NPDC087985 TaxID=3366196 RepID=UPI00380D1105